MWSTLYIFLLLPLKGAQQNVQFDLKDFRENLIREISNSPTSESLLESLSASLSLVRQHLGHPEPAVCDDVSNIDYADAEDGEEDTLLVQVGDFVYDLHKFEHPGGDLGLLSGDDLTSRFLAAHQGEFSLLEREDVRFVEPIQVEINGRFFDLTRFAPNHPGGALVVSHGENLTSRFLKAHGDDFTRLTRKDIREVNLATEREKKRVVGKTEPQYGGNGGVWREWVGRRSWFLLHSLAAKYPEVPTEDDKQAMRQFVAALGQLYPCKLCRKHLQQQLRDPSLGPVRVHSRTNLTTWMCELHNLVNKDIGKPQFDCTPFHLDLIYLKDCGECEHTTAAAPDPKTQLGYHPTTGTWDAALYGKNPELLQSLSDPASVWEARSLDDLVEALITLNSWFGILDEDELRSVKSDLKLPQRRLAWTRHFNEQLRPLLKPLIQDSNEDQDEE